MKTIFNLPKLGSFLVVIAFLIIFSQIKVNALVTITIDDYESYNSIDENLDGYAEIAIYANGMADGTNDSPVAVNYQTIPDTASTNDFVPVSGTLMLNPGLEGEDVKYVKIPIINDAFIESTETFYFFLSSPSNAVLSLNTNYSYIRVKIYDEDEPQIDEAMLHPDFTLCVFAREKREVIYHEIPYYSDLHVFDMADCVEPIDPSATRLGLNGRFVAGGDFDGDGRLDYMTSRRQGSTKRYFFHKADALANQFVESAGPILNRKQRIVGSADVNGDGTYELVVKERRVLTIHSSTDFNQTLGTIQNFTYHRIVGGESNTLYAASGKNIAPITGLLSNTVSFNPTSAWFAPVEGKPYGSYQGNLLFRNDDTMELIPAEEKFKNPFDSHHIHSIEIEGKVLGPR